MGEAGDPKVVPQFAGQGHHRTAQHQGRQQAALVGPGLAQKGGGDAPAQVGDGGGGALQQRPLLHPQLAPDALAPQPLLGARQQGVGGGSRPRQGAGHPHLPALLQGRAAGKDQLAGAAIALQHHPAPLDPIRRRARLCPPLRGPLGLGPTGLGHRIRPQPSLQLHRGRPLPLRQPAHRILWPGLGLAGGDPPDHQGPQPQGHQQGAGPKRGVVLAWG